MWVGVVLLHALTVQEALGLHVKISMVVNPQYKRRSSLFVTLNGLSTLACSMRQYSGFGVVTTQAQYTSPLGFASTTPKDVVFFILVFRFSFFSLAFSLFVFPVLSCCFLVLSCLV